MFLAHFAHTSLSELLTWSTDKLIFWFKQAHELYEKLTPKNEQ